jgi:hypothetical protein
MMDILEQFHAEINEARAAQSAALTSAGEGLGEAFGQYHTACEAAVAAFTARCQRAEEEFERQLGLRRMAFMGQLAPLPIMPRSSDPEGREASGAKVERAVERAAEQAEEVE